MNLPPGNVRPVLGVSGYYVSEDGIVWSNKTSGRWKEGEFDPTGKWRRLKMSRHAFGYKQVRLTRFGKYTCVAVHTLVLESFKGPPPVPGMVCRHKDGNPLNNTADNLCWGTQKENMLDRRIHGTYRCGVEIPQAKLNEQVVRKIRDRYRDNPNYLAISREFGVTEASVRRAVRRETWKHVS